MSQDFWRMLKHVDAEKSNHPDVPRDRSLRIYRTASPEVFGDEASWSLQLRAPMKLANGREGKDFMIATAVLSIHDLIALRDEADAAIRDVQRDRERMARDLAQENLGVEDHAFTPSRYADVCARCGGRESDGVHKLSTRTRTRDLRRPK